MKIYTRKGDTGQTGLFGGARVSKADQKVEAYGTVDEANAVIGLARAHGVPAEIDAVLERVQRDLFTLGAELACVPGHEEKLRMELLHGADVVLLEQEIDRAEADLPQLRVFILPTGSPSASALHLARGVVRRAERQVVRATAETVIRSDVLTYLNRLSDLLFVLARRVNHVGGIAESEWSSAHRGSVNDRPGERS